MEAAGIEPAQGSAEQPAVRFPEPGRHTVAREAEPLVPQMLEADESTR
jgi:hypothetical protein